jgi:hypothetical protein
MVATVLTASGITILVLLTGSAPWAVRGNLNHRIGVIAPWAIIAAGVLFGLLHFPNHPGDVILMLPYHVAVSAIYGGLTWATNSILPALVLHSVGDIVVLPRWWVTGRPEWQLSAVVPALVWDGGVDASFTTAVLVAAVLGGATAWSYRSVHARAVQPAGLVNIHVA